VIDDLRQAVLTCRQVVLLYRKPDTRAVVKRMVHPYGFLYDHRHYLVAFNPAPSVNRMAIFRLANIQHVGLQERTFRRDPGFSLRAYAERSFGVWQEDPFDVVWRFPCQRRSKNASAGRSKNASRLRA
jgi:predicted DNA-binding transcriptional regulator YafY